MKITKTSLIISAALLTTSSLYAATVVNTDTKVATTIASTVVSAKVDVGTKATTTSGVKLMLDDDNNDNQMEDGTEETDVMHTMNMGENKGAMMMSAKVKSDKDLEVFTTNVIDKDTDVEDIDFKSESEGKGEVSVIYKHKGKLFWLFPVTVASETHVYSDANSQPVVDTGLSWWSFLVSGVNYDRSALETSIKNNETVKSNISVNASATAKAVIAETVIAQLQANAKSQMSTK